MTVLAKLRARAGLDGTYARTKPIPPHGTLIITNGQASGWVAPKNWHPHMVVDEGHPVTRVRLGGMLYHEGR